MAHVKDRVCNNTASKDLLDGKGITSTGGANDLAEAHKDILRQLDKLSDRVTRPYIVLYLWRNCQIRSVQAAIDVAKEVAAADEDVAVEWV